MASDLLAATADLAFDDLVPVAQGKVLYVLEWNSEDSLDGMKEAFVIVVLKRAGGCLLAIPEGFLSVEDLKEGGEMGSILGSSISMVVNAMHVDGPSGLEIPVVIADVDQAIVGAMRHAEEVEETAMPFLPEDPFALPSGDELVAKSLAWLQGTTMNQQEGWYSQEVTAESEINTPKAPKARPSRAKAAAVGDTGSGVAGKPKRQTTATLAASVQAMMDTLPALSLQMQEMMDRQQEQLRNNQNPAAVLRQPLSSSLVTDPRLGASAKAFGSSPPPPTTQKMSQALVLCCGGEPAKVQELASQKEETAPLDVTQAILAQSTALTSLVAALAGNQQDPMQDLQGATSGTRGALGRAKLQEELAQQRGTFFHSVVQQMSRRMMPTSPVDQPYAQLVHQGVTGTPYLERFGGYGKQRELGLIQFQLMTMLDFAMVENWEAVKDTLALLIVMVEQACLDQGRFDLGQLLTLQEDPPASIFTNRQLSQVSRAKAFSPLANQRWVTVALAFLKELDTIVVKRGEILGGKASGSGDVVAPTGLAKVKGGPKKKGRGKGRAEAEEEQGEQ